MATLTGQTIASTYDALLKVTDNGPITSSLKLITDGLGNNTALSLSNVAASINGNVTATSFIKSGGTSTQYLMADGSVSTLTNPITGTGTTNYLSKFTSASALGNSLLYDNNTGVIIGGTTALSQAGTTYLSIQNNTLTNSRGVGFYCNDGTQNPRTWIKHVTASSSQYLEFDSTFSSASGFSNFAFLNGDVLINTTTDSGFKLDVNGTSRVVGKATFSDSVGIGSNTLTQYNLRLSKTITGAATSFGIYNNGVIQSDVTSNAYYNINSASTLAASFTLGNLYYYYAQQGTIGAGSAVTNQYGFVVDANLIGATNNFGFRGRIPAQANAWNLYMDGTANNYLAGSLGIGTTTLTAYNLRIDKTITGATTAYGFRNAGAIQSDVTSQVEYFRSDASTQATAFSLSTLRHFSAIQGTFGAGSSVGTQVGFRVDATLVGATNNYGFSSAIPAATNNWNLYMIGTAKNYLEGNVLIGSTTDGGQKFQVTGLSQLTGTTASDGASLGSEQLTTGSGTNWTGTSYTLGYAHTIGSTAALTSTLAAVVGTNYLLDITITGRTAGTISASFGGVTVLLGISTSRSNGVRPTTTGNLIITPTTDFDGTITASVKVVTVGTPIITFRNSATTTTCQIRTLSDNVFIGTNAGSLMAEKPSTTSNSTGNVAIGGGALKTSVSSRFNVAIGLNALQNTSNGDNLVAVGANALFSNTSGLENVAVGAGSLNANDTGFRNVAVGHNSLNTIIGSSNIALGYFSGRYAGSGTTDLTSISNSIFIGYQARALNATGDTNEVVIGYNVVGLGSNTTVLGNSSTTLTAIYGTTLIGSTTDNGSGAKLQVNGNVSFQNVFNRRTASYTLVLTDQNDIIEMNVASANNLTIPLNATVAFPIGTEIAVLQYGAGQTTIVATGGVTLRSKANALKISGQYAGCTLVKVGTDEWYVIGDLTA